MPMHAPMVTDDGQYDGVTCFKYCPRMVSVGPSLLHYLDRHLKPHKSVIGASQAPGFTAHKHTHTNTFTSQIGAQGTGRLTSGRCVPAKPLAGVCTFF